MSKAKNRSGANTLSSFSTVVGITLVLSMLGALFIVLLVANSVTKHFKEQLTVQLFLKEGVEENEVLRFKKEIEAYDYSGEVKYTSAQEAAESMQEELGEEFVEFLGYNPLPASIDIQINPDFAELESLESKISDVAHNDLVDEVVYQKGCFANGE
ncbi:MAG: permease-like cell division protein FtsX [Flavobacteriales bacterium]